jgi:hypothetical protein
LIGAAFGHADAEFFFGVPFATVGLSAALCETCEQCSVARVEFRLGLDEIEGVGEQFNRFAKGPAVDLALDSLFGGGVEGDGHGMSIRRERGGGKRFLLRSAGFVLACGSVELTHRAKGCAMDGVSRTRVCDLFQTWANRLGMSKVALILLPVSGHLK